MNFARITDYTEGQALPLDRVGSVDQWHGRAWRDDDGNRVTIQHGATAESLQALGLIGYEPLTAPPGGVVRNRSVVIQNGVPVETGTVVTAEEIAAEEAAANAPTDGVINAALGLQAAVVAIAHEFGVVLGVADGYEDTYQAIFGAASVIPEVDRARVWARIDTAYRNLDYHVQKWQSGASTWDLLPTVAAYLEG